MSTRGSFSLIYVILILTVTRQTSQSFRDVINKHNFGFTLQDQGEIKLATAYAKIIFHYELPSQIRHFQEDINCSELPTEMRNLCRNVRPLLVAFGRVRTRGFEHLKRELNYIYDIFYEFDSIWSRKRWFFYQCSEFFNRIGDERTRARNETDNDENWKRSLVCGRGLEDRIKSLHSSD